MMMSLLGGVLIGLASSIVLVEAGRVCGISGMVGGILTPRSGETRWRFVFVLGLVVGGVALSLIAPNSLAAPESRGLLHLVAAGLLVGFGTRLGNGCTSGHGVCGLSRRSKRSFSATMTFMAFGMATATVVGAFLRGGAV